MPESDGDTDLSLLIRVAKGAGQIAMRYWRNSPRAWDKDDGAGPVTEADLAVNAYLEAQLRAARPDYGWLSEESPDDATRTQCDHVFIIDPIDGTRAFIAGERSFAIALAVARKGAATSGVVYLPALDKIYAATIDGRLLSFDLLAEATRVQSEGFCPVLGEEVAFGLGFVPTSARRPLGPNLRSFGHFGTGGSLGFGDPDAGVAFGYVMNHVIPRWQSTRNRALIDAVYASL